MKYGLTIVYIIIAAFQIPSLIRQKCWRELTVFTLFWTLAFTFALLLALGVKIPSPLIIIQYGIQDRFGLKY